MDVEQIDKFIINVGERLLKIRDMGIQKIKEIENNKNELENDFKIMIKKLDNLEEEKKNISKKIEELEEEKKKISNKNKTKKDELKKLILILEEEKEKLNTDINENKKIIDNQKKEIDEKNKELKRVEEFNKLQLEKDIKKNLIIWEIKEENKEKEKESKEKEKIFQKKIIDISKEKFNKMTIEDLKKLLKDANIKYKSNLKKDDLLDLVNNNINLLIKQKSPVIIWNIKKKNFDDDNKKLLDELLNQKKL